MAFSSSNNGKKVHKSPVKMEKNAKTPFLKFRRHLGQV